MAHAHEHEHAKVWKKFREANLMSQAGLARALGLSRRTVQNVELGSHAPNYTSQLRFRALKERYERVRDGLG